ncbi:MAG: 3'-5' exonuclease [Proteobacteria bacterium]|nr:3'-5' exonuclease [Pseudomonadota bacterium]
MNFGLIVDVETTGLDPVADKIIEIGLLEFCWDEAVAPRVTRSYGSLHDPERPISADIIRITGLSDAVLAKQAINWEVVRDFFRRTSVVIAHNADFDRSFLLNSGQLDGLDRPWACSLRHIDWRRLHCGNLGLNYLAADHGFVNPFAHQALFDCATTFRLVAPHLSELLQRSSEKEYLVKAVGSPFESKDLLKQRGYRWDAQERVWSRVLGESALVEERQFLQEHVYKGRGSHHEQEKSF